MGMNLKKIGNYANLKAFVSKAQNQFHSLRGQLGFPLIFSSALSALKSAVAHVIRMIPKPKMFGIDAVMHVALMEYEHPIWNWSFGKFPGYAVGFLRAVFGSKHAVTIYEFAASPEPAGRRLFDFLPESFSGRFDTILLHLKLLSGAIPRTVCAVAGFFFVSILPLSPAHAETVETQVIGPFGTLNTQDNPAIIGANEAQDMLNVDITPSGRSIKKREGLSLDYTFSASSNPVHGAYKFFNSAGSEVRLWGQDIYLRASVAGAAYVNVATGTLSTTWQCTDYLGYAYCFTSSHNTPVKTDGTTAGTTYLSTPPLGTMCASTPDRLLVAGVAAQPQRLYYSGSTVLTDFTLGTLETSSSYEDITAPGSAITHLAYRYGKWLWWKDQSFGFLVGTNQFDLQNVTVSNTIGTLDNTDVYDSGITYFRGNDNQFYAFDGSNLQRISREITPTVNSTNKRKIASWQQTSQSDFSAGGVLPSNSISTSTTAGDVVCSTFGVTESTASAFNAGSLVNTTVSGNTVVLSVNSAELPNNSFESGQATNWTVNSGWMNAASFVATGCTLSPQDGSKFELISSANVTVSVNDCNSGVVIRSATVNTGANCSWTTNTLTGSGISGRCVKLVFTSGSNTLTSDAFTANGNTIQFYAAAANTSGPTSLNTGIDNIVNTPRSTITSGSYSSKVYDTYFSSSIVQATSIHYTVNTATPTFALYTSSAATGPWTVLTSTSGVNKWGQRYYFYSSTITQTTNGNVNSSLNSVTLLARSTGTYYSAVNNAPNLTSWGAFALTDSAVGASTITYYTRAATNTYTTLSSTPAWVAQPRNATVAASTGTYFQMRADFTLTAATETPALNDFTFNWVEGSAADKMYGVYFNYAIWFAVSLGTSTTVNNRILRYDLLNQGWTMYDIASNGLLVYNNELYVGDSSTGKTGKFGGVNSDYNSAISAYWKSKEFFGSTPFQDEDIQRMSWYCKSSSGTTLTVTYQVNQSTSTSYSINLYDSSANMIRHNYNMPLGTRADVFNVKIADNSTNPAWECFAGQYWYITKPWNVWP